MLTHDSARIDDVRAGHLFVTSPVCRPESPQGARDENPLRPTTRTAPEEAAIHRVRRTRPVTDQTDRWIALTETALRLAVRWNQLGTFEAAVLCHDVL